MNHELVRAMSHGGTVLRVWHPASQFAKPDSHFLADLRELTPGRPAHNAPLHSVPKLAALLDRRRAESRRAPAAIVAARIAEQVRPRADLFWAKVELPICEWQGQRAWGAGRSVSLAIVDAFSRARRIVSSRARS